MKIGAVSLLADISLSASVHLVVVGVVLLFLPAMRILAPVFLLAAIGVSLDEILGFPLGALVFFVLKYVGFSPEVLPIVGVNTGISWMGCV